MKLKNKIAACALALCAMPFAATAELSKAEWQAKAGDCANNPSAMKATIAQVPAADQAAFVAKVNEAIAKKPGSTESKAADFYAANKAAVSGAADKSAVLAEVYATVPVEYLTDINERFATELFSRNANPAKPVSDQQFVELSTNALAVVNKRCESAENAGVRQTFAALMFVRASGGSPSGLTDTFVSQMTDPQAKESGGAWISEATGAGGKEASYDNMLAAANAGDEPDRAIVASIIAGGAAGNNNAGNAANNGGKAATGATTAKTGATSTGAGAGGKGDGVTSVLGEPGLPTPVMTTGGPDVGVAMLGELTTAKDGTPTGRMGAGSFEAPVMAGVGPNELAADIGVNRVPRALVNNKESPYYKHGRKGGGVKEPEPTGYDGQGLNSH